MNQQKKTGLDQKKLRHALKKWQEEQGRGAWQKLGQLSGLDAGGLSRICKGQREASINTWLKLHQSLPAEFPLPSPLQSQAFSPSLPKYVQAPSALPREQSPTWWKQALSPKAQPMPVLAPVFRLEEGLIWDDQGLPASPAQGQVYFTPPAQGTRYFFLRLNKNHLRLSFYAGDLVLIEGKISPDPGELCLATWPDKGKGNFYYWHRVAESGILLPPDPGNAPELIAKDEMQNVFLHRVSSLTRQIKKAHRF